MGQIYSWASPDVISGMTLSQLWMYLDKAEGGPTAGGRPANAFKSKADIQAYCDAQRKSKGLD